MLCYNYSLNKHELTAALLYLLNVTIESVSPAMPTQRCTISTVRPGSLPCEEAGGSSHAVTDVIAVTITAGSTTSDLK